MNDNDDKSREQDRKISDDVLLAALAQKLGHLLNGNPPQRVLRALAVVTGQAIYAMSPNEAARRHNTLALNSGLEAIFAIEAQKAKQASVDTSKLDMSVAGAVTSVAARPVDRPERDNVVQLGTKRVRTAGALAPDAGEGEV